MNFIILTAALSAMNSQLYASTRMIFSLSEQRQAPAFFKKVSRKGVPVRALLISTMGIFLAAGIKVVLPDTSYAFMMGISMFGAIFTWFMVFISHLFFRRNWERTGGRRLPVKMYGYPYLTILGAIFLLALTVTTWFTESFKIVLQFGIPWLIFLWLTYMLMVRVKRR